MFEHSVKVPRNFKIAANIVKKVITEGGGVKNLLYDNKLRHFRTNVIYALVTETIKHADDIDKIFESTGLLEKEPRLDRWLAKVIITELLFGKKELPGGSKPEKTILSYKEQFEKIPVQPQDEVKTEVRRPRYVRINTNLLTTSDAIRAFQDEGYRFIRCTSGSYNDYLEQIKNLTEYDFTQDYHVKTMFVFHPSTKFHDYDLYLENKIILQDKATALPVQLLAPPQGSVVLDMCAAPGNKTTQLAAFIRNQGKIYAVERKEDRYKTLCDFVEITESKCVTTMHRDSLDIKRGECEDVEYIVLDPSCSGSGMQLSVHNYVDDVRLSRLTSLQEKFLKHAMNSFPNAKKIVYSTCSVFPEENERVISNVVKQSRAKWKVLNVKELLKEQWNNFGSGMYGEIGTRCLYARPESDFTTGFFLAVLERDSKQQENQNFKKKEQVDKNLDSNINDGKSTNDNEKDDNSSKQYSDIGDVEQKKNNREVCTADEQEDTNKKKKKSKKNKNKTEVIQEVSLSETQEYHELEIEMKDKVRKSKSKNKEKHIQEEILLNNDSNVIEESNENLDQIGCNQADVSDTEFKLRGIKKKKKKNKELTESVMKDKDISLHVENNLTHDTINCEIEQQSSSKKKKKSKHSDKHQDELCEQNSNVIEILSDNTVEFKQNDSDVILDKEFESNHIKKKKKKKNIKEISENVEVDNISKEDEHLTNAVNCEIDQQSSVKKRKKSKHSEIVVGQEQNDSNIATKKKKKKSKD